MATAQEISAHASMTAADSGAATATARIERNLAMTPEADRLIAGLARETGVSEGEVLRLALGLFKAAVDARHDGKHVGIAETPDALDVEFVGF